MKKPVKINTNREPLSSDEIKKHQNFKNTWKNHYLKPKPFYKNPKFFGGALLILTTVVVLIIDAVEKKNASQPISKLNVIPPLKELDIKPDTFLLDAAQGDTLLYESGTQLIIPANSFVNENGDSIKGKVEIQYREFNSSLDLFLCGIPMGYDSAGVRNQFESAGMMEIQGFQNNKPVYVRKTKSIVVNMASLDNRAGVNLYRFDSTINNWTMIGKDSITDIVAENAEIELLNDKSTATEIQATKAMALNYIHRKQERRQLIKIKPFAPTQLKSSYENFTIDFDSYDFPELSMFENVKFQLIDSTIKISTNDAETIWEAVTLEPFKNNYQVVFYGAGNKVRYQVTPAFEEKDLPAAKLQFTKKMESYVVALTEKKKHEKEAQRKLLEAIEETNKKVKAVNDSIKLVEIEIARVQKIDEAKQDALAQLNFIASVKKANEIILQYNKRAQLMTEVTRSFGINGFGIYNCDRILDQSQYKSYTFALEMPKNVESTAGNAYVIYRNTRSVINNYFNSNEMDGLKISIRSPLDCKIIVVVDDKTIAVCKGENIKKAVDNKDYKLEFETVTIQSNKDELVSIFTF